MDISSSFLSVWVWNGHAGSISRHFLFFLSITFSSGLLCLRVFPVWIGKILQKILQSSNSKSYSKLRMYLFLALLNHHFSHSSQCMILAMFSCLICFYSFCASFEHSDAICATFSSATPHRWRRDWKFSPSIIFLILLISSYGRPGLVLPQYCFQFLSLSSCSSTSSTIFCLLFPLWLF